MPHLTGALVQGLSPRRIGDRADPFLDGPRLVPAARGELGLAGGAKGLLHVGIPAQLAEHVPELVAPAGDPFCAEPRNPSLPWSKAAPPAQREHRTVWQKPTEQAVRWVPVSPRWQRGSGGPLSGQETDGAGFSERGRASGILGRSSGAHVTGGDEETEPQRRNGVMEASDSWPDIQGTLLAKRGQAASTFSSLISGA